MFFAFCVKFSYANAWIKEKLEHKTAILPVPNSSAVICNCASKFSNDSNHILYACCRKLGQSTERVRTTGSHFSGGSSASWRVWERGWRILMPFWSIQYIYSYLSLLLVTCMKTFASVCNTMQIFWKGRERECVCLWKVCIKWKSALDKKLITTDVCVLKLLDFVVGGGAAI